MNNSNEIVIGIDVGTTSVKVGAFRVSGECLFSESTSYATILPGPAGWVEQNPEDWVDCIAALLLKMNEQLGAEQQHIKGLGIVSQVNTHVFVSGDNKPLMNAIVWQDQRCADTAARLDERIDDALRIECWGKGFAVDASFLMSRAEWVREHKSEIWDQTACILSPKDYCLMRLTKEISADAISSIGLVGADGEYLQKGIDLVPGLREKLPPIKTIYQVVGHIDSSLINTGCPAFNCTMDAWGSLYGSGIVSPGKAFQVAGTSEVCGIASEHAFPAKGVVSFPPLPGWYLHAGPTQLGGGALKWFSEFLNMRVEEVLSLADQAKDRTNPMLFLPHTMGERAPLWDSSAKGAFIGLNKQHELADMAKSVLEGVGHASRLLFTELKAASGIEPDCIFLSGGASRSDLWCQIKADILGIPLHRLRNSDTGIFGAALISMVGLKIYVDLQQASEFAVTVERVFTPDEAKSDYYDSMHAEYFTAYKALRPVNSRLSAMQ